MKWTFENFEASLKDLNPKVREKALKLANQKMEEKQVSEEQAIEEAIKEAGEWYLDRQA